MNLDRFDLNLLLVFDAVAQTGSVTAAAARLKLSQPAISHALNRLRGIVHDPLFVRTRNMLVPTPRAQQMTDPVHAIVEAARGIVRGAFDPSTSDRAFRVGGSDFTLLLIVPALLASLRSQAPRSTLDLVPIEPRILAMLESGELDCSFWGTTPPPSPYYARTLFRDRFIGLVGRRHPLAAKVRAGRKVSLDDYLAYPHAMARFRDPGQSPIDAALIKSGRTRTIGYASPNFSSNLAALLETDLVASIPSRLATVISRKDLIPFELPIKVPGFAYSLIWHRRTHADPACEWLRTLAAKAASGILEGPDRQ